MTEFAICAHVHVHLEIRNQTKNGKELKMRSTFIAITDLEGIACGMVQLSLLEQFLSHIMNITTRDTSISKIYYA